MSGAVVLRDITDVVPVVVEGWSDVESFDAVIIESGALIGCFVDNDLASSWGEGIAVVVVIHVDL